MWNHGQSPVLHNTDLVTAQAKPTHTHTHYISIFFNIRIFRNHFIHRISGTLGCEVGIGPGLDANPSPDTMHTRSFKPRFNVVYQSVFGRWEEGKPENPEESQADIHSYCELRIKPCTLNTPNLFQNLVRFFSQIKAVSFIK